MTAKALAKRVAVLASERKAIDIQVLELAKLTSFTDYFVVCSGSSDRQVKAIADSVEVSLKEEGQRPIGAEGAAGSKWVLVDYGSVVLHVFYEAEREYYALEKLWFDAPRLKIKGVTDEKREAS